MRQADSEHPSHQLQNEAHPLLSRGNRHPIQLVQRVVQEVRINVRLHRFDLSTPLLLVPDPQRVVQLFDSLVLLAVTGEQVPEFVLVVARQIRLGPDEQIAVHRFDELLDRAGELLAEPVR
ncbi:hypothetical protein D3C84_884530 [compost metagenome]